MLTNTKYKANDDHTLEVACVAPLAQMTVVEAVAANAAEFKDSAASERRARRRFRTSRNIRHLGSALGGWKVTSW